VPTPEAHAVPTPEVDADSLAGPAPGLPVHTGDELYTGPSRHPVEFVDESDPDTVVLRW